MVRHSDGKFSIAYVIESLGPGGAQRQLVELIRNLDRKRFDVRVLTYYPQGFFQPELEGLHVPVWDLVRRGRSDPRPLLLLARWLRSGEVDLINAFMPLPAFYSILARQMAGRGRVVAALRGNLSLYRRQVRLYGTWAYKHADVMVANSNTARSQLLTDLKIDSDRALYIPNGLDMIRFSPVDDQARSALRRRLGWPASRRIVLTVANFSGVKNHLGILHALESLDVIRSPLRFCWAGPLRPPDGLLGIRERIAQLNLTDAIQILGPRNDVVDLYRASDVLLLNSISEGTPNVVLEAMACGCPVIATDVSDVSQYVLPGRTGWLIPPDDPQALRGVLGEVSTTPIEDLREMGDRGREHLSALGIDCSLMARRYERVYLSLLSGTCPNRPDVDH